MPILTVIALAALTGGFISFFFAISGKWQFYWLSAIGIYVFSFIAGFSIGQLTVGLTFIPLALAVGYSLDWIKTKLNVLLTLGVGAFLGVLIVLFVDDRYTFFPFWIFI